MIATSNVKDTINTNHSGDISVYAQSATVTVGGRPVTIELVLQSVANVVTDNGKHSAGRLLTTSRVIRNNNFNAVGGVK